MASNPTPKRIAELLAAGDDLADGMEQHGVAIGVKQNTAVAIRADLDALIAAQNAFVAAEGANPAAYVALRTADSNAKGFIAAFIKTASLTLGTAWSDAWIPTGLLNNTVGVPRIQDDRFTVLGSLKAYLAANPDMEVTTPQIVVTAAEATARFNAVDTARSTVTNALTAAKNAKMARDAALEKFRTRFRSTVAELEPLLGDDDPRWYDFGLSRPADPAQPEAPLNVVAAAMGGGAVLVQVDGARRANSFNYYRKIVGTDPEPVKVENTEATQFTILGLPVGATVEITVAGVNDAGEGQSSAPVAVTVS